MEVAYFDTETTGLTDPEMIQFAAVYDSSIFLDTNLFFKPKKEIEVEAMAVHHITPGMVMDCDKVLDHKDNIQHLLDNFLCIAHNLEFDLKVLRNHNFKLPENAICSQLVAQKLQELGIIEPNKLSLQYLRYFFKHYNRDGITPHDALSDCRVLRGVFSQLLVIFMEARDLKRSEAISIFKDFTKEGMDPANYVLHFGVHKGLKLKETSESYLAWCLGELGESKPDLVAKIQDYFNQKGG